MADPASTAWGFYLIEPQYSVFVHSLSTSQVLRLFSKGSYLNDVTKWKDERWKKLSSRSRTLTSTTSSNINVYARAT
ncbi:hypothetical protein BGZ95_003984 [Linnemannia exigua]|uniref:Uncharacterized protein n=1 Tax=Linnemannia exigua TaxID=604196 RepID=A0AAD4DJX0_9FUNG|nr:hypothetical protein BGZ95_003984 [Linnemannia exigua]